MAVRPKKDKSGEPVAGRWVIDYYPQGRKGSRRQVLFGTAEQPRTEGEALALETELRRVARREPVSKINPKFTGPLADWKATYKHDHATATVKDLDNCLVHLVGFFGKVFISEIGPQLIEQYKTHRLQAKVKPPPKKGEPHADYLLRWAQQTRTVSRRTINKELSYLSGYLKWCNANGYASAEVKVKLFPAKQTKPATARPLHPTEVNALLEHLEPHYQLVFLLYNDAGLRRSEALGGGEYYGLRREDIDLKHNILFIRGKGNKERIVPIATDRLRAELETATKNIKSGPVCINPKTKKPWYSIRKALIRAAAAAGIERRVYHHLLRHNFGTHATAAGLNLRTVQEIMGHSTIKTTEIYTHMAPYLQDEAAKLQQFVKRSTTVANDDIDQIRVDADNPKGRH